MSVAAAARTGRRSVACSVAATSSLGEAPIASSSRIRLAPAVSSTRNLSDSSRASPKEQNGLDASNSAASGSSRRPQRRLTQSESPSCLSSDSSRGHSFNTSHAFTHPNTRSLHSSSSASSTREARLPSERSSSVSPFDNPSPRSITPHSSMEALQAELTERILPGFPLPDEVALQVVTHESWDYGKGLAGHNRRLSFLGRRALKAFLVMFFDSILSNTQTQASQQQKQRTRASLYPSTPSAFSPLEELLHTSALGQGAGASLRLERVMRWTPAILPPSSYPTSTSSRTPVVSEGRETGLFKVRGVCLEAVVGAIYHQHGASMAKLFFDSQILPTLTTRDSRWSISKDLGEWVRLEMERCAEESTRVLNGTIQAQQSSSALASEASLSSSRLSSSATAPTAASLPTQSTPSFRVPPPSSHVETGASRQAATA